jgi:hypothetical protein
MKLTSVYSPSHLRGYLPSLGGSQHDVAQGAVTPRNSENVAAGHNGSFQVTRGGQMWTLHAPTARSWQGTLERLNPFVLSGPAPIQSVLAPGVSVGGMREGKSSRQEFFDCRPEVVKIVFEVSNPEPQSAFIWERSDQSFYP